jgi:tRNA (guanine37-N1)-methyltransferase
MKIALITLFPEMFAALTDYGVSGRAVKEGLVEVASFNPRDYTEDRHQTVDARPYGGGPGMVMLIEPLRRALTAASHNAVTYFDCWSLRRYRRKID